MSPEQLQTASELKLVGVGRGGGAGLVSVGGGAICAGGVFVAVGGTTCVFVAVGATTWVAVGVGFRASVGIGVFVGPSVSVGIGVEVGSSGANFSTGGGAACCDVEVKAVTKIPNTAQTPQIKTPPTTATAVFSVGDKLLNILAIRELIHTSPFYYKGK